MSDGRGYSAWEKIPKGSLELGKCCVAELPIMRVIRLTHCLVELCKGVLADVVVAGKDTHDMSPAQLGPDIAEVVCVRD